MKLKIKNMKFRLPRFRLPKVRTNFSFPTTNIAIPKVVTKVGRVIFRLPLLVFRALLQLCYGIAATPREVGRSPLRLYRKASVGRVQHVEGSVLNPSWTGA